MSGGVSDRRRILVAGRAVLDSEGFGAGLGSIALRAGLDVETVQDAYPGVAAVVRDLVADFFEKCLELADAASEHGGDAYERYVFACAELSAESPQIPVWAQTLREEDVRTMIDQVGGRAYDLLVKAQLHGRIRTDIRRSDLEDIQRTMARLIMITGDAAPVARRRWLALMLAGMRPGSEELAPPAVTATSVT
jgi:hypothetical protein